LSSNVNECKPLPWTTPPSPPYIAVSPYAAGPGVLSGAQTSVFTPKVNAVPLRAPAKA